MLDLICHVVDLICHVGFVMSWTLYSYATAEDKKYNLAYIPSCHREWFFRVNTTSPIHMLNENVSCLVFV